LTTNSLKATGFKTSLFKFNLRRYAERRVLELEAELGRVKARSVSVEALVAVRNGIGELRAHQRQLRGAATLAARLVAPTVSSALACLRLDASNSGGDVADEPAAAAAGAGDAGAGAASAGAGTGVGSTRGGWGGGGGDGGGGDVGWRSGGGRHHHADEFSEAEARAGAGAGHTGRLCRLNQVDP
jgi:hypothetical protein